MNQQTVGWINGFLGVLIFSASLPATRLAVIELPPLFLTTARATIAGLIGVALLAALRQPRPSADDLRSLVIVALGVVVGFPLLTAFALQFIDSSHSVVYIGLLPLMTAIFAVLRGGERPKPAFWLFSVVGSSLVAGFALYQGSSSFSRGDVFMLFAIIVCGLGYAEGASLSRKLGGWQVISWALLISLPIMAALMIHAMPARFSGISFGAWAGLAYVSVFSMMIGFIFWYRGLALGGIARVGQLQLLQPFFGLALSARILHEQITPAMILVTGAVVLCVFGAKRFA